MSSYNWPPSGSSGGGVPVYANVAAFPNGSAIGDLAIAADTGNLYEWNGSSWVLLASEGAALSLGNFDSQTSSAKGAGLTGGVLAMQSATGANPGSVNTSTQTFAGAKTFSTAPIFSSLTASLPLQLDASKNVIAQAIDLSGSQATGILAAARFPALTGDVTTSSGAIATTLATVNSNVGAFGSATQVATFTVNAKGLTTAASNTSIQIAESQVTNLTTDLAAKVSTTLTSGHILVGNASNVATDTAVTGNVTITNAGVTALVATTNATLTTLSALSLPATQLSGTIAAARMPALTGDITSTVGTVATTLATVNANTGSFGSSTAIPSFTVNGKGLITAAATNVVIAPAGTLSGTTLNSTVVTSSLTSVGTIATGTWNGTAVDVAHGGTGNTSATAYAVLCGGTTSTGVLQSIASVGTSGQVLTSNGPGALPSYQATAPLLAVTSKVANYTALTTDNIILCSGSSFTVTLYTASGNTGRQITIKKTDSSLSNVISVQGFGGTETIDGATNQSLYTLNESATLVSDGTNWRVLDHDIPSPWSTTTTITWGGSTTAPTSATNALINHFWWRRAGGDMECRFSYSNASSVTGAAAGTGDYWINVPSGATIDTSFIDANATTGSGISNFPGKSFCFANQLSTAQHPGYCPVVNTTSVRMLLVDSAVFVTVSSTNFVITTANIQYGGFFIVPIVGWGKF